MDAVDAKSNMEPMTVRAVSAVALMAFLCITLNCGHSAIASTIVLCVFEIFRELVNVGMGAGNVEREIPLYRALQWLWFAVAMLAAYTSPFMHAPMFVVVKLSEVASVSTAVELFLPYRAYTLTLMYCAAFMLTVLSFKEGHYSTQLHILAFTSLALSLFMVQLKVMIFNLYTGLFWFVVPLLLVIANDTAAYFAGKAFGRRFFDRPLLSLSPKKSWEGFVGGGAATLVCGQFAPQIIRVLMPGHWLYLACSYEGWSKDGEACVPPAHFGDDALLSRHCVVLAAFASVVAPFGGFMASAIKRAYKLKDFDSFIPGHGGLMDRLDCQFLMAVFTCAHVGTFLPLDHAACSGS
jgi:phosphatidate cytidylyltransferase